ncbi:MAG: amidohydrolase family protein [Chloroflexota bacterium]
MLPIIDTHQHLWDLKKFQLPWLSDAEALNSSYLTVDYKAATEGDNVVKTVYMEVDVDPSQQVAEAEYIISLCEQDDNPTSAAVISGRPAEDGFKTYIDQFKDSAYIKGIRQVLHVPDAAPGLCLTSDYVAGIEYLGESGLSFDLCMRPGELLDGAKLAETCPGTQFIVDHCGNADPSIVSGKADENNLDKDDPFWHGAQAWKDAMAALAAQDNVVCKISGIIARAAPDWTVRDLAPTVNHCLDVFGPDRVIFGGDWPVCTLVAPLDDWIGALRAIIISRSPEDQQKLLHDNAARLYGLEKVSG